MAPVSQPAPAPAAPPPHKDRTLALLSGAVLFYTVLCVGVAVLAPAAKELYTLLTGLLGGFSGALLLRLKG